MRVSIVKLVAAVALAAASLVGVAGPVAAQQAPSYPISPCGVTTVSSFIPGTSIIIRSTGGVPNGTTTFTITQPNGDIVQLVGQNDAQGNSSVTFQTPNLAGIYTISTLCPSGSSSPPTTTVGDPNLPVAGSDSRDSLRLAGVVLVLGFGLFVVSRRRRQEPAVA